MTEGKNILFINDASGRATCSGHLMSAGYQVDTAEDASEGLDLLDEKYDLVIIQTDSYAESWHLCERIRRLTSAPLIVVSTDASAAACVRAINAGADFFLRKPCGPLEIVARVRSLLQRLPQRHPEPVAT